MSERLWFNISNIQVAVRMLELAREYVGDEYGDTIVDIGVFFKELKERISYSTLMDTARKWDNYSLSKQVETSVNLAGEYNASRFMLLLDVLSEKIKKGEL